MNRSLLLAATSLLAVACIDGVTNDTGETGDTAPDFYDGPLQIQAISDFYCDDNGTTNTTFDNRTDATSDHNDDTWNIEAETDGLAALIQLDIYESGTVDTPCGTGDQYCETHLLDNNVDYDPNGYWDQWQLDLERTHEIASVTPGEPCAEGETSCTGPGGSETATTFLSCWWADSSYDSNSNDFVGGSLAFRLTMYDNTSNPEPVDCVYFGFQSEDVYGSGGVEAYSDLDCICFEGSGDCSN